MGDARSNYGDLEKGLFRDFAARAKRVIWLNLEAEPLGHRRQSTVYRHRPFCAQMSRVALERS
ncbi:MAG: hypothetical protein R3C04_02940 [Hyphomonas sp.]